MTAKKLNFLKKNQEFMPPEEIAKRLGISVETVRYNIMKLKSQIPLDSEMATAERELIKSPEWALLENEFTPDELEYFKHRYSKLKAQLKDDLTPSEDGQLQSLIKFELLKHRNLYDQKSMGEEIYAMQERITDFWQSNDLSQMTDDDKKFIQSLEQQLSSTRQGRQAKSVELNEYDKRISALSKELKGLREQRLKNAQDSASKFIEIIKELMSEQKRNHKGKQLELYKKSVKKQTEDFAKLHVYADGMPDQPLLNSETVMVVENA